MELQGKKIEFDLEEFVPLLLNNKQEGFRLMSNEVQKFALKTR